MFHFLSIQALAIAQTIKQQQDLILQSTIFQSAKPVKENKALFLAVYSIFFLRIRQIHQQSNLVQQLNLIMKNSRKSFKIIILNCSYQFLFVQ